MTSHRKITSTLTLLAVLMAVAPASTFANSLLSGYGGPGEGSQAILGSALVGGGGGGSSNGSSGSSGSALSDLKATGAQTGGENAAPSGSNEHESSTHGTRGRATDGQTAGGEAGARSGSGGGSGKASSAPRAYPALSRDSDSRSPSEGSAGLGFSGEDLGYVLLVLGALALTGVVTRRLTQASARTEGL
jgi:hypothetical protein